MIKFKSIFIRILDKIVFRQTLETKPFINTIVMENNNQKRDQLIVSDHNNKELIEQLDDNNAQQSKRLKTEDNNSCEVNEVTQNISKTRIKTRKWVLLLSYCGHGYYGMQRQSSDETYPTIEGELMRSLWKSGAIDEDKYLLPHTARFQRAARTDKGVSAIKQIVSIILPINFLDFIPKVNDLLPQQIRLINGIRVTKFFDAKNFCDGRTYSYLMPSYSLCPFDQSACNSFRITKQIIDEFNEILSLYLGTHNFHNFTAQRKPTDPSSSRYIIEMSCSQPFIKDEIEFVVVRVRGQSFMLHQIRKMIGLAIAVMRGFAQKQTIIKAFNAQRLDIPIAPGLGLLLEEVHYDRYNAKYGGDGCHEHINWDQNNDQIDEFKHKFIYSVIVETEKKEMQMFQWLQTLPLHSYDVREPAINVPITQQIEGNKTDCNTKTTLFRAFLKAQNVDKEENEINEKNCDSNDPNLEEHQIDSRETVNSVQ